jgi:tRNA nucleotidyltransferase/poly(A) polymerase
MAEEMPGMKRARSVQTEIALTPQEDAVFKVLSDAKEVAGAQTVIRVVGGWVRDKVLGMESDDIDIALDDMTGADFAECVLAHLNAQGIETSKLAVIERNPEQSKHLETATMKVEGVSVDFVGLRAEEYAAGSRIPEVRLGTADEDALRRDLTINALFYRVDTGQVEDLTGRGLAGVSLAARKPAY